MSKGRIFSLNIGTRDGNLDRVPQLAEELVRLKVDLIVTTGGDPVIRAARNATKVIPIVMVGGGSEPVARVL